MDNENMTLDEAFSFVKEIQEKISRMNGEYEFADLVWKLGPVMGFGRMMQIISFCWRLSAEQKGYPVDGALVSALLTDKPAQEQESYIKQYETDPVIASLRQRE